MRTLVNVSFANVYKSTKENTWDFCLHFVIPVQEGKATYFSGLFQALFLCITLLNYKYFHDAKHN